MPTLMERPADSEIALLTDVADGFAASGHWPVWQYVLLRQASSGADGEAVLRGMPVWQHNYRSIWTRTLGASAPPLDAQVGLTVHGLVHLGDEPTNQLVAGFLAALRIACDDFGNSEPSPTTVRELVLEGTRLTERVNISAGTALSPKQLGDLLRNEPSTWSTVRDHEDSFAWDLTRSRIHRYRGVASATDYLAALEAEIGLPPLAATSEQLPAGALLQSVDRLNLVWKLVFGEWLLTVERLELPLSLARPAVGYEDFESRCSALADLITHFDLAVRPEAGRSGLDRMRAHIERRLGDEAHRAVGATGVLQHAKSIRDYLQHSRARAKYDPSWTALGLLSFGDNWSARWEHLRRRVVDALDVISDELVMSQRGPAGAAEDGSQPTAS